MPALIQGTVILHPLVIILPLDDLEGNGRASRCRSGVRLGVTTAGRSLVEYRIHAQTGKPRGQDEPVTPPSAAHGSILLVRHGQTAYSAAGRHTGLVDVPLNADGERQARALGPIVGTQEVVGVWCSPLLRARQTAELAGLADLELDAQLQEWDYGGYDGLTSAQISELLGRPYSLWRDGVVPGDTPGETLGQVRARCDEVIGRLLPRVLQGDRRVLVAHGHQLRVLATSWLELPPEQAAFLALGPASLSVLAFEDDQRVILAWNAGPNQPAVSPPSRS